MVYRIYRFRKGWEQIGFKHNIYDVFKIIGTDLNPEFDIHYVVIENDGKSDFPIITINTLQQYYEEVEKHLGEELTNNKKYVKIKMK